ncbi:hypothetical protein TRVL_08965 [Trypanosoma vivax]|nr:hypothetical protein TRVL_08965 [Trypanosoma vivax]
MQLIMSYARCAFARMIKLITALRVTWRWEHFPIALATPQSRPAGRLLQRKASNAHIARAARKSSWAHLRPWYLTIKKCSRGDVQDFLARSECRGRLKALKHETRQCKHKCC